MHRIEFWYRECWNGAELYTTTKTSLKEKYLCPITEPPHLRLHILKAVLSGSLFLKLLFYVLICESLSSCSVPSPSEMRSYTGLIFVVLFSKSE